MRKLIVGLAITLDGYIEGPNGEYDWCFTDQDYGLQAFFERVDAIFIGRKSYEMAHSNNGEIMAGMPKMTEYVFSTTLKSVKEGAVLISDDSIANARRIKEQFGKDIWLFGGASLTDALMKEGLVDELWMSVHPILLGGGKLLFREQENRTKLTLLESKTYETGLVSFRYSIHTERSSDPLALTTEK
jgi:dihydrofolate reductase